MRSPAEPQTPPVPPISLTPSVPGQMPPPRTFYATNRGGGLFSEAISQRIGAIFAAWAYRLGLPPTALTLANLAVGLAVSATVVGYAHHASPGWPVGVLALVGWQIAYALDCADGQLARVSGRTSPAGARVDVLCDVAAQIALVTAISATAVAQRPGTPVWLVAVFAGTWMVNLVTSVLQSGPQAASMVPSRSLPVRMVKLLRDYGAVIALTGAVLLVVPEWTVLLVVVFSVVNGGFLAASIAFAGRASLR